ncbi:E3 ubiquitin-protein ligase Mdm2-like isoform X1 [Montipora capricornis]|uniref:E3 ubiquitin-protein ligase Mdm2-like isoform X1 n=2 Tax=Montipora foliosa TaxID=591990 RepID=UPI0035F1ECB1
MLAMDGALVEKKACKVLTTSHCDSSDNEQGSICTSPKKPLRKRKREALTDVSRGCLTPPPLPWCMGFFSSTRVSESESELSEPHSAVFLVKGYESAVTAVISDSEDDLFFLEETVEFEPPGSESEAEDDGNGDEESDDEVIVSSEDEDPGADGGDEYEEGQDLDSDIDEEDLWACPECSLKNHPMSRQCARCWVERHEWLPHLKRLSSEPGVELPVSPMLQKCASLPVAPSIESPLLLSSSSSLQIDRPLSHSSTSFVTTASTSGTRDDQERISSPVGAPCLVNSTQAVAKSSETKDSESAFSPDLCVICLTQPRNASLVHGRTGHQVCCIGCAERLKENKKKCPVCRKKIKLVVKNFF